KEVIVDKEHLFQGRKEREGRFDKREKRKGKSTRYEPILNEQEKIKEATATVKEFKSFRPAFHLKKKKRRKERVSILDESMEKIEVPVIEVSGPMTVENLSQILDVSPSDIIVDLMDLNIMATKNQLIDLDTIRFIAEKYGVDVQLVIPEEEEILLEEIDNSEDLVPRAPVVTVMGHVDHGKTSLLDRVRSTNVAATESGSITQHIAAYEVMTTSGKVVFLDTPGHEAFTQMRARGAKITDIVVLVVAADDGVQPQTIEAIDHAKAAEVPIIVAINKCDKPEAQPDRVRQELVAYDLIDEAWGGKTIMKNISAKTGEGVNELLELIILQSQMMDLKANPKKKARGTVIEAEMSRGFGPVAWVLVQNGTLSTGDICLVGSTFGKIRAMFNSKGEHIREALPSTPVLISGLEELPDAGDTFVAVDDEKKARLIAEKRQEIKKFQKGEPAKVITLEEFHNLVELGEQKKLYILVKADVQGSADVLKSSLSGLGNEQVSVEIVRSSVGEINESDVLLAQVSKAVIIGFNVGVNPRAQKLAEETGVEIRKYEIIYDILEDVRKALSGLLKPILQEVVLGHAEIRQIFKSSSLGNIAGCFQLDGITVRGALARIIREGKVIYEDRISSLKRGKDDVREISTGFECGIKLEKFEDIKEGDIIETYRMEEIRPSLN
ncbi:MAG TPA: translation initiation factor IF-2, partial [Candidatus Hydrogenedens sp.]|nr:translation initiation factor IF-2 [Candidatus Hydrogenedens sp.]